MEKNVQGSTLRYNLCIGCGICDLACSTGAIKIVKGNYQEKQPFTDPDKCISCSECVKFCPNTRKKLLSEGVKINRSEDPLSYGIKDNEGYIAYDKKNKERLKSSSGGYTSALLKGLIRDKKIKGIIHGERVLNTAGCDHYSASYSTTMKQIDKKRGSHYSPLCFSEVIRKNLRKKRGKYVLIGTPCVIRGYKKFFSEHEDYSGSELIYIALTCSHIVNNQFIDFLSESLSISREKDFF
ncbi:MAG: 4Fe-4S binding protein, partial [Candidatus Aminicenantes bacterium]|nr:4Fe-4S binding protein [Candidatus Aminicenantes bacterium]